MNFPKFLAPLLLLTIWAGSSPTLLAQVRLTGPQPGVLSLRNGQVISGNIFRDGDRYLVTLGETAEIRINVDKVEFHAKNLTQLYHLKRSSLVPSDRDGHVQLVEWCLRHGLVNEATQEINRVSPRQRGTPAWTALERRLVLARQPRPAISPIGSTGSALDDTALEKLLASLPTTGIREFTSFVQPLLLNRCSTAACHGTQSKTAFKLIAPPRGRSIPTRYTKRNLHSTWQTIRRDQPDQSPLINITTAPHGGAPALFTQREWSQYQRLVTWVRHTAQKHNVVTPSVARQPANVLAQPQPLTATVPMPQETSDQQSSQPTMAPPMAPSTATLENRVAPVKQLPGMVDPVDPGIFNRRFHADRFRDASTETPGATSPAVPTPASNTSSG